MCNKLLFSSVGVLTVEYSSIFVWFTEIYWLTVLVISW